MRTIRKTRPGESHIHNHGTVAGGETIAVADDTAEYLVDSGGYEYAESDAQSEPDTDEGDGSDDLAEATRETRDAGADELTPLENVGGEGDLSELTYQELRDLASEHDISGRSDMDKADLVDALGEVV